MKLTSHIRLRYPLPFFSQGAEDFRTAKRQRDEKPSTARPAKQGRGVAFGSGVMDEDDVYGMTDDYVTHAGAKENYDFDLHSDEEGGPSRCFLNSSLSAARCVPLDEVFLSNLALLLTSDLQNLDAEERQHQDCQRNDSAGKPAAQSYVQVCVD